VRSLISFVLRSSGLYLKICLVFAMLEKVLLRKSLREVSLIFEK
jgi:hypothetical protein